VGIAEEHAVSMAAGLAKQGMTPVVALYSTFLQRSFDQILQDVALLRLHVVFAVDRCGLVGEDGETHHGVFDSGYLRLIPGLTVLCPASCLELSQMLTWATEECTGPVALRYPRGTDGVFQDSHWDSHRSCGFVCHKTGTDCTLVTYGTTINSVLQAAKTLGGYGIDACVLRLLRWNDFDEAELSKNLRGPVFVVEETMKQASVYPEFATLIRTFCPDTQVFGLNLGDTFVTHGSMKQLLRERNLDSDGITRQVMEVVKRNG
jgi:1-deoxy-D-xylulose-5-phosphate synthase